MLAEAQYSIEINILFLQNSFNHKITEFMAFLPSTKTTHLSLNCNGFIDYSVLKTKSEDENFMQLLSFICKKKLTELDQSILQSIIEKDNGQLFYESEEFNSLIGRCVGYAEEVNMQLVMIISAYIVKFGNSIVKADEKEKFDKKEFSYLVDLLTRILRNEIFSDIENLTTKESKKAFLKNYRQFVIDRNIYTHGKFQYKYPSLQKTILYKKKDGYYHVDVDRIKLEAFLKLYRYIRGKQLSIFMRITQN
jgi:hypothetical protein